MMKLSTSSFYYRPRLSRALRDFSDAQMRDEIESIQAERPYAGYRMVRQTLFRRHRRWVNGKKLRRIMGHYGLAARVRRRFITTTDSKHGLPVYPNLIAGITLSGINQVWAADITYIRIATGFVYLAVILDLFSRRVVGWAISKSLDHRISLQALRVALENRKPGHGLIHHSDRGAHYVCEEYTSLLQQHGVRISMSRAGNPYDNAFAESFIHTLKKEEVYLWEYDSFVDVVQRIPHFIEDVYNRKRIHSGIRCLPPAEFEAILSDKRRKRQLGQITLTIAGKRSA
jgi:transposase InsO family protein